MRRMIGEECRAPLKQKNTGLFKIDCELVGHEISKSLGVSLNLQSNENVVGGWTMLSLFLGKFGNT